MRWFMPAPTWLTAWPVRMSTHVQGWGRPFIVLGQVCPVLRSYVGWQPSASWSLRLEFALPAQSRDCVWLPLPATRSVTSGAVTDVAFDRTLLTPICTTRLWVQLACTALHFSNEPPTGRPFSSTCATLMGPERVSTAPKERWTVPNEPLHLLPPAVEHVLEPTVPFCSSQPSVTSKGPAPEVTGIVVAVFHWPVA